MVSCSCDGIGNIVAAVAGKIKAAYRNANQWLAWYESTINNNDNVCAWHQRIGIIIFSSSRSYWCALFSRRHAQHGSNMARALITKQQHRGS